MAATGTHAMTEKMLGPVFSEQSMPMLYYKGHLPVEHKINEAKPQAINFSHGLSTPDTHVACKISRYNLR
jgi:hypothetical protein